MLTVEHLIALKHSKLILATHNPGKLKEIRDSLGVLPFPLVDVRSLNLPEPVEDGSTFLENAKIKALEIMRLTGLPTLADDSGLSIDALGGQPGVHTADWFVGLSGERDFYVGFKKIKELLPEKSSLGAAMFTVLVLAIPGFEPVIFEGSVRGSLLLEPKFINHHFPFDCFFIPEGSDKPFIEQLELKDKISARARAIALLKSELSRRM